jgi:preprotein translocase subunit SecY
MASRADNIASNLNLSNFSKATELKRIWFTVGALIVFRFLSFVPLPGVNPLILDRSTTRRAAAFSTSSTPFRAVRSSA